MIALGDGFNIIGIRVTAAASGSTASLLVFIFLANSAVPLAPSPSPALRLAAFVASIFLARFALGAHDIE